MYSLTMNAVLGSTAQKEHQLIRECPEEGYKDGEGSEGDDA